MPGYSELIEKKFSQFDEFAKDVIAGIEPGETLDNASIRRRWYEFAARKKVFKPILPPGTIYNRFIQNIPTEDADNWRFNRRAHNGGLSITKLRSK